MLALPTHMDEDGSRFTSQQQPERHVCQAWQLLSDRLFPTRLRALFLFAPPIFPRHTSQHHFINHPFCVIDLPLASLMQGA
jgi:hypothetical protein